MNIKHTIKRRFTMVEILLASAVMGAGLTLILILFPVALRNAQATVINSYVPMTANYFINLAKARIATDYEITKDGKRDYYRFDDPKSFVSDLPPSTDAKDRKNTYGIAPNYKKLKGSAVAIPSEYNRGKDEIFKWVNKLYGTDSHPEMEAVSFFKSGKNNGCYLVLYKSLQEIDGSGLQYSVVDFAAEVNILKDKIGDIYPYEGSASALEPYAVKLYIHVSWPIEVPLANRQSRLYVLDVFNSNFGRR